MIVGRMINNCNLGLHRATCEYVPRDIEIEWYEITLFPPLSYMNK